MQYSGEKIRKNIFNERKRLGLTQKELGEKIGLVGKQISAYEKGKPTPPIDVMFKLCEVFDCELGYLLGEPGYTEKTALRTAVHDLTGLSDKAIDNILRITGKKETSLSFGYEYMKYRRVLNNLLSDEAFIGLVDELANLDDCVEDIKRLPEKYYKKYGKELFDYVLDNHDAILAGAAPEDGEYADAQYAAVSDAGTMIDTLFDLEYSVKIERYEVREVFEALIERLYPRKSSGN